MDNIRVIGTCSKEGKGENQFTHPRGVCLNRETKELFIVDCNNHRIQVYHLPSLAYVRQIGKGVQGNGPGYLTFPVRACLDDSNNLFIADTNNHRISIFNSLTGCFIRHIGSQGSMPGQFNAPYGICVDEFTGLLYVADYENNRIQVFDKETGDFIRIIGDGFGVAPGKFNQPIDVCLDLDTGFLYVADYANNRVQVLLKDSGQYIHTLAPTGSDSFNGPRSLHINKASNLLFVSDRENHRIHVFDRKSWKLIRSIGHGMGTNLGQFNRPMETCVDDEEGVLIVVDGYNHRVQIIELDELQKERQRLLALKRSRSTISGHSTQDIHPSRAAIQARIESICTMSSMCGKTTIMARFSRLSCCFDMPIVGFTSTQVRAALPSTSLEDGDIEALSSSGKGCLSTTTVATETVKNLSVTSGVADLLAVQGTTYITVLEELASQPISDGLLFTAIPAVLAVHALIARGWQPDRVSTRLVDMLFIVMHRVTAVSVDREEGSQTIDATMKVIQECSKNLPVIRDHILTSIISRFSDQDGISGEYWIAGSGKILEPMYHRSLALTLFDLLHCAWLHADPCFARLIMLPREQDASPHLQDVSADMATLLYGRKLFSTLHDLSEQFHNGQYRMGTIICEQNSSAISGFALPIPEGLGIVLSHLQRLRPRGGNNGSNDLEGNDCSLSMELLSALADCINRNSVGVAVGTVHYDVKRRRGGRNIWLGDQPLAPGDLVDCMDKEKCWFESIILEVHVSGSVRVHFLGWGSKWDDTISATEVDSRIAPLNTFTKNWRADLFEGGLIEIKCNDDLLNQKWMWGRITRLNIEEAWVEISYTFSNEAPVVKKAWLYSETICPVGMHTKEKSKAASATISRPAKTVEEIMRERSSQGAIDDDEIFADSDDDYRAECGCVPSATSHRGVSLATPPSFVAIAHFAFQSAMSALVTFVMEHIQCSFQSGAPLVSITEHSAARKFAVSLARSPWRHLLVVFFLRPLYVHAGALARLVAGVLRQELKEASSNDLKSFLGLAYNLERLKALFGVTMESLLSEAMPSVAMRHIKGRLDKTIDCCGFSSIASSLAARFRANSDLLEEILQPLLSPARFDQSHRELRNLFRGVLKASDPEVSQRLVEIIDETVVVPRIYRALEQVLDGTVRTAMQSPGDLAKALVLELAKLRSIFGNDLFGDRRTALAMERALLTISVRLGPVEANRLGDFLAHILRWISNGNGAESGMMLSQAEGELLVGAIKMLASNEVMVHMRKKYLELILLDLTKYDGSLTFAERSILTSLPIAEDLVSFVDEVDVSVSCSRRFGGYLLERLDQGAILNLDVLQMMSNSCDAINVFVLSAHRWRTQIASLPMLPHLPPPLEVICKEFEAFHQLSRKNGGGGKSRLVWALGLGRVLLSMMKGCCHIGEIVVDELQCSILLAISSGCSTLPELCKFGNFDMETAQSLLQSLSSSDPTRPGLVLLEGSMDVLSIHTKISINADFFIASSKSTVEIADPRSAVYATSSRVAWRRDVIDAAIARTMKALSRSTNKCSGLNIVAATMSKLREAHPRSLFTSNEVEDRLDSFHRSGLIDEVSGKSSPPRSNEEHLFPSIADASLTSAPPSRPTSLLEMQECLMQSIMASDEYCDSLTEEKCNRISFVPVVPFCNGLLHWVATKDWKVETRLEAIIVRSDLNDARPSYDALHDTGDSFSQVLLNMAGNLMNAAAFSLGALIHQTNLLLNQFYVAAHGLPLNQPLLSLESLVRPLSALRSSSVGLWADFLLREVVLVECVGMIGDFAKVFRYCVVEGDDDAPSMEALNAVISGQTLTSSDRWALWSHKFTMECPSAPPHPQRQLRDLYTLLVRCLDESASGSLEESDMVEGKSVERMTSDLSSRKLAFGTFMRATIAHQWAFMKGSAPAFMSQSHHISPPPVPEMAAKRVMLPWDPSEEAERQILLSLEALSGASSFLSPETCSKNGNIRSGLLPPRTNRPFNRSLLQSPFNSAKSQAAAEELCPSIQTTVSALAKMVGKALVVYQARPAIPAETDHLIHITASSIDLSMDLLTKINDDGLNLWWSSGECAPRSIRQVLSGAYDCLTAVLSEQPPLTHRASNHLFSQTAIPAVMESLHMNVDDLLHEQGKTEFATLIASLAQVTGSQWAQCAMSFAQANFNIDAFFEIHYGSSESSSSTMSCLFEPPVNSSQMNHTCEHCKLRRPLSAFRALSCGHFACMDCWAIRTMRAIDSNAVRVGCIGTPSGRYCPMAMKVEAVAQVASEGVNFQRYLSNLFRAVERGYTDRKGRQGGVKDLDETMLASIHACDICSLTGRKVDGHALVMEAVSSKMAALRNRCWQSQDANELATIAAEQRLWSRYHSLMLLHDHLATSKIFEELDPTMRYKALLDNALTSWHTDGGSPRAEGTVAAVSRALSAQFRAVTGPLFKTYQWLVNHHRPLPAPKAVTAGLAFSSHTIELILDNRPCLFQLCEESV